MGSNVVGVSALVIAMAAVGCSHSTSDPAPPDGKKSEAPAASGPPAASASAPPAGAAPATPAPIPLVTATASPATQAKLGISQWKVFRGAKDLTLTGYNAQGSAVKGVSVTFANQSGSSLLKGRVMDGSNFATRYDLTNRRAAANGAMGSGTAGFLKQSAADFRALRSVTSTTTSVGKVHAWSPSSGSGSSVCGGNMIAVVTSALDCINNAGASSSGGSQGAIAQCLATAEGASDAGGSCSGVTTTFDPTGGGTSCYGMGGGSGFGGDSWGGGGGWGDDDDDGDCDGMDADWAGFGDASWGDDPFGDDGGGFGDFDCDPGNGGVSWGGGGGGGGFGGGTYGAGGGFGGGSYGGGSGGFNGGGGFWDSCGSFGDGW
jgi:hypothetical protein